MLVKARESYNYMEDFGLLEGRTISFYENGDVKVASKSKLDYDQVVRVNVIWNDKPLKVKCSYIADTEEKKTAGLEVVEKLEENEGMYFPYKPYSNVTFHQGRVAYPLDILFVKDDQICHIETSTKVGSTESWSCLGVSGVIEVNAGFCEENDVVVGDRIIMFACSDRDIEAYEEERKNGFANFIGDDLFEERGRFDYLPNAVHLLSVVADVL